MGFFADHRPSALHTRPTEQFNMTRTSSVPLLVPSYILFPLKISMPTNPVYCIESAFLLRTLTLTRGFGVFVNKRFPPAEIFFSSGDRRVLALPLCFPSRQPHRQFSRPHHFPRRSDNHAKLSSCPNGKLCTRATRWRSPP